MAGGRMFEARRFGFRAHHVLWALGAMLLPLSHYWLLAKVEPFYSLIYCFLWWPYILVADFAVFKLRGRSMLSERPWEFLTIWFWSMPLWLFFELINLRLQNWYYVMAPVDLRVGSVYMVFGFGAVLPGVFETAEVVVGLVERFWPGGKISGQPFGWGGEDISNGAGQPKGRTTNYGGKAVLAQMGVGAAMLVLVLAWPATFCAMTWGFAFFFLDPLLYWLQGREKNHVGRSLLGQMAAGDNTRLVALLVAGLVCGGLWEGWNLHARTKWIYTVPFFDELKLGEMPIIGFLGFPPFVLECYAMVNLLSYLRRGRNWEWSAEENARAPGMRKGLVFACCVLLPPFLAISGMLTMRTVSSFAEPITYYLDAEIGSAGVEALRARHAEQTHELLKLKTRPEEIDPAVWERLQRLSRMSELKGMGIRHALALERNGITNFAELAKESPGRLTAKLAGTRRAPRVEMAKIWIMAAKRKVRAGEAGD
jgi:hypothetical protein